ncbi:MAG: cardiolipin synthase [Chthoniobacterales bacterium]
MLSHWFDLILGITFLTIEVVGVICAIRAVFIARTPQAAIAWGFGLICLPIVAIPLFLIFGESKFFGYVRALERANPHLHHVFRRAQQFLKDSTVVFPPPFDRTSKMAERMTSLAAVEGNDVSLLIDGKEAFDTIFDEMANATDYILIQFFSILDDSTGKIFLKHVLAAAERGIRIWVFFDAVGSHDLTQSYIEILRKAGVETASFVTNRQMGRRFQLNFRNHRKLVVVDGRVAIIGGLNIGDKYMGLNKRFGPWRDTNIRMTGPVVEAFITTFIEDWNYATDVVLHFKAPEKTHTGSASIFALATGPFDSISACHMVYLEAIQAAEKRIWITSPYLVPDFSLRSALQAAALRGVDVRIMLPQVADHLLPWLSSFSFYPVLRRAGIKVFRYQRGFLHQKVLLVDDEFCMIGSVNLDYRSFLLNFELTAGIYDPAFAKKVEKMLLTDFTYCKEEDLKTFEKGSFFFKLKVKLASLLSPEQ